MGSKCVPEKHAGMAGLGDRVLVEKYVKLGLKREMLLDLLFNVLSVKLDDEQPPMDTDVHG